MLSESVLVQDGWTSLLIAADEGHIEVVRVLLAAGADAELRSQSGFSRQVYLQHAA